MADEAQAPPAEAAPAEGEAPPADAPPADAPPAEPTEPIKHTYTLFYFNVKALAEPLRYLFAYGGIEYEDVRVTRDEWPALKPSMYTILIIFTYTYVCTLMHTYRHKILSNVNNICAMYSSFTQLCQWVKCLFWRLMASVFIRAYQWHVFLLELLVWAVPHPGKIYKLILLLIPSTIFV